MRIKLPASSGSWPYSHIFDTIKPQAGSLRSTGEADQIMARMTIFDDPTDSDETTGAMRRDARNPGGNRSDPGLLSIYLREISATSLIGSDRAQAGRPPPNQHFQELSQS